MRRWDRHANLGRLAGWVCGKGVAGFRIGHTLKGEQER